MKKSTKNKSVRKITLFQRLAYFIVRPIVYFFFVIFYGMRTFGIENVPKEGAALLVSNHQSYLDPPVIGAPVTRRLNYLARIGLFKSKFFARLILTFDAISVDNEGIGFEGVKETLKRLKNGEMVLIFPEGARTFDGKIAPFKQGYLTLALRSNAAIVPVAIFGIFEAWPRTRLLPHLGRFSVMYGEPILPDFAKTLPEEELHELVQERVRELYDRLRNKNFIDPVPEPEHPETCGDFI